MPDTTRLWAVVLSGGEGMRLRPLVRQAIGDERPKQYVKLLGPRSLLRQTLDRAALGVSTDRTVLVTVCPHAAYITEEFAGAASPPYVLVQPGDRGTAAGVLYPAYWILRRDPEAILVVLPSDHFVLGEATFTAHIKDVVRSLGRHPDRLVLLGSPPTSPDEEYGWIEPGGPLDGPDGVISAVRRLWEEPTEVRAQSCLAGGCLWNTGVVIARAATLAELGEVALPEMSARLARIRTFEAAEEEPAVVRQAYALMRRASFSRAVLEPYPERLAVSRLSRVTWCDLDSPHRVLDVVARIRVRPAWVDAVAVPPAPGRRAGGARGPGGPRHRLAPRCGSGRGARPSWARSRAGTPARTPRWPGRCARRRPRVGVGEGARRASRYPGNRPVPRALQCLFATRTPMISACPSRRW